MLRRLLFPLVTAALVISSSIARTIPYHADPPVFLVIDGADTLETFVAEALNRSDLAVADKVIETQLRLDSNAIQWHFFRGIRSFIEISYEQDKQNEENFRKVEAAMEKAIEIGEKRIETSPTDSIALFYTGGAYGYLGIAQLSHGGYFKAGSTAKKGFKYHEKLIELCPGFHDAYLGPGMKNFMVSALPWIFKPILYLLGLTGTEEKAEEYLAIAYEKGKGVHLEAGGYLAQLYERRKDWAKSEAIYADLLRRYPYRVGMCAQGLGPLYWEKKYDEVVERCRGMMKRFENDGHVFTRSDSLWMVSIIWSAGNGLHFQTKEAEAIRCFEDALRNRTYERLNKWRLWWSLGDLYRDQRRIEDARTSYQKALAMAPEKSRKNIQKDLDNLPSKP
jgi:tetratricopeptide (TPR) repeat protein